LNRLIRKILVSIFLILYFSTLIFSTQSLDITYYKEGGNGGGIGDPLDYNARYDSKANILQASGYAYAHSEHITGSLGEAWAWFWLADSWTCKTSGTYEIIMQWSYNGEAILKNHEFLLSASTSSAKGFINLFVESAAELSKSPQSTEVIFFEYLDGVWNEQTFSIDGTTELRYKAYFEKGKTYRLRGALEVIVFARWIDGVTWGSSTININGRLEKITILSDRYSVTTSVSPSDSGYITGKGTYGLGDICELTAHVYGDYEFDYWGGDISGKENPKKITVDKDTNVIAYFKKIDDIDFSIEMLSSDKTNYDIGEIVKLNAKIRNTGTKNILPYNAEINFKIVTPNGKLEDAGKDYNTKNLAKGEVELVELFWIVPSEAEVGCYDIEATIKVTNGPTKSDEVRSAFCLEICTPPKLSLFNPKIDGLIVEIDGFTETDCPDASITGIHWDWGDGYEEYNLFPASHTYNGAGTYTVWITSYQSDGLSTKKSVTLTVESSYQLELQILGPSSTVKVLPINYTVKITSEGKAVSDAEVSYYQIYPRIRFIGSTYSKPDGLASYADFQKLDPGAAVTWFAIAKKSGYQDGNSLHTAYTYQPCIKLEIEILAPASVVISTPINFTIKVTCGGQPVSGAVVDFYQDAPYSEPMEFGVMTDNNGIASHTNFIDDLPPNYHITWHAITKKLGYKEGRGDGELVYQP
jgi:hypothetical protein